ELRADSADRPAIRRVAVEEGLRAADDPSHFTGAADDAVLAAELAVAGRLVRRLDCRFETVAVLGVRLAFEQCDVRRGVGGHVVNPAKLIRPVQAVRDVVVVEDADSDDARGEIELRLALDETLLRLLARGG